MRRAAPRAVVSPGGKRLGSHLVETNARSLIEAVRQVPGPRHLCLEEGTLSERLYEVLSPHVQELVVAAVEERPGSKGVGGDAFDLRSRKVNGPPVSKAGARTGSDRTVERRET